MTTGNNVVLLISAFVYFQISFFLLRYFDENVNRPYMDEIFHVPQAQQYCRGNYNEVHLSFYIRLIWRLISLLKRSNK